MFENPPVATHAYPSIRRLILATLIALSTLISSCETVYIYQDYPVEFDDPNKIQQIIGDPEIIPGTNEEQLFSEIEDGDTIYIIHGFQGGTWVHLSIRVTGLKSVGTISASLGLEVGDITYDLKLILTAEGFLEAYDIPIPVPLEGDDLEALYGQDATLEVRFTTDDGEAIAIREVVLGEG